MKKKGFTLVELLAVIAILAILVIMALPAVLRMFNQARKDSFTNEVNTIIRTSRQHYLLSGGQDTEWSNAEGSTKSLDLTGNSRLRYYVKMDNEGKIVKLQATNGDFQYNEANNAGIDVAESSDVQVVSELDDNEILVITKESTFIFVNRQSPSSITVGDEVALDTEHFYVISSNSDKTVLLSKYNLYVGDNFSRNLGNWDYIIDGHISPSDDGYGLQSATAKYYTDEIDEWFIGAVAFAGTNYWDNSVCQFSGINYSCTGAPGLKSDYSGNYFGNYPYVYRSDMSSIAPNVVYGESGTPNGIGCAQNNGYTIAYYVENYVNTLKSWGAPSNITGRLLKYEEANNMGCNDNDYNCSTAPSWLTSTIYWIGSVGEEDFVWYIAPNIFSYTNTGHIYRMGVRPVIEIPTSSMPE